MLSVNLKAFAAAGTIPGKAGLGDLELDRAGFGSLQSTAAS